MQLTRMTYAEDDGLLRLCADDGTEGWAPGVPSPLAEALIDACQPVLVGQSPWERDRLWQACRAAGQRAELAPAAWGHVDIALWDLLARAQGLPLFRAMGGFRDRIPIYRVGSETRDPDVVVAEAEAARAEGALGYGLQAVCAEATPDLLRAIRSEVGADFRILCDGGQRFDLEDALRIGRALEAIDGHWFAEPLRDGDVGRLQKLSDALSLPVVAGAFMGDSMPSGTRALSTRAVDRLRVNALDVGGLTAALKLARGAEALQMNCEIHSRSPYGLYASAHVMGAVRNAELLAVGALPDGFEPLTLSEGYLQLPSEPGLGLRLAGGGRA